jgi:hypothetical protein
MKDVSCKNAMRCGVFERNPKSADIVRKII